MRPSKEGWFLFNGWGGEKGALPVMVYDGNYDDNPSHVATVFGFKNEFGHYVDVDATEDCDWFGEVK